jgi:hypothetical protein
MKKILLLLAMIAISQMSWGQVAGNSNYQNQIQYANNSIDLKFPTNLTINIKGLANITAENYVAIFSVSQIGKTAEEVNTLMDNRLNQALNNFKNKQEIESYIDMISFVPLYEYEVEKKIFSKKTYSEVPKGFELKKNIHIKYKNPNLLNEIIATLASAEIYDLVRVDYFSDKIDVIKADLVNKAKDLLQDKIKNYKQIVGAKMDSTSKKIIDGFKIVYPIEMYQTYQAYASADLNLNKNAIVNQTEKSTTLYYQPIVNKDFDFVINPVILEPVIQVLYEIKIEFTKENKQVNKEYFIITPNGELKKIDLKN